MSDAITIAIADDHPLFRQALSIVLKQHFSQVVLLEANTIDELKNNLEARSPDLILLDLNIPGANGFEALIETKQENANTPIILISGQEDSTTINKSTELGASAFLAKSSEPTEMVDVIKQVLAGEFKVEPIISTSEEENKLLTLTPRQLKILGMFAKGLLNKQIAADLEVSEATVKAHATAIFLKLNVKTRTQAVIAYQDNIAS
ncbi:response regulator transcription factor [Shewanella sp. 202IG2-18]|uniref:response regulator n=1 Tax=Parashewanella hymeniacidonis TaxID=2807618 RepID=UPI0019613FFF|nr:response regulator transcription factor [Parashewanella hymeniacidonis]MBM7073846.1 response regulator transcription factor [Parashewanella hymeniacidonis]